MSVRRRRTAEESRAHILEIGAKRLRDLGLDGLNITGVAEEAGISHATLIHHFGSSGGMRDALADKMTRSLIEDLVDALGANAPPAALIQNVFEALASGGHAKLLAWRAVEGSGNAQDPSQVAALFAKLLDTTRDVLEVEDEAQARRLVYLVAIAALGHGLAGGMLAGLLGMSDAEIEDFPDWVSAKLI